MQAPVTIEMLVNQVNDPAARGHRLTVDDLPVPADVQPTADWTPMMVEMAEYVGAYTTLLIVDRFGGRQCYVSADPDRNIFSAVAGAKATATLSRVYGSALIDVPVALKALRAAKRGVILAAVRQGVINASQAARIMRCSRVYVSRILNGGDEGRRIALPRALRRHDPRQLIMFGDD